MIQPLLAAINWFLGFFAALPLPIQAFLGLAFVLFALSAVLLIIQHSR